MSAERSSRTAVPTSARAWLAAVSAASATSGGTDPAQAVMTRSTESTTHVGSRAQMASASTSPYACSSPSSIRPQLSASALERVRQLIDVDPDLLEPGDGGRDGLVRPVELADDPSHIVAHIGPADVRHNVEAPDQLADYRLANQLRREGQADLGGHGVTSRRILLLPLPFDSVFRTLMWPTSAVLRTWVPPSACLSRPTMSTTRISLTESGIKLTLVRIRSASPRAVPRGRN